MGVAVGSANETNKRNRRARRWPIKRYSTFHRIYYSHQVQNEGLVIEYK